jgi:hypothetical protein
MGLTHIRYALSRDRFFWLVIAIAILLRIGIIFTFNVNRHLYFSDTLYYIRVAQEPNRLVINDGAPATSIGPIYPLFLTPFFQLFPAYMRVAPVVAARLSQAFFDVLAIIAIYLIAQQQFGQYVARIALVMQALDLRYVLQISALGTETLFITLFVIFMLAYLIAIEQDKLHRFIGSGALLGLAVLTRPIPLIFPAVLAIHIWFSYPENRRRAIARIVVMTLAMGLIMSPWIIRLWVATGSLLPISNTGLAHFWLTSQSQGDEIGGTSWDQAAIQDVNQSTGQQVNGVAEISQQDYLIAAFRNILAAPSEWIQRVAIRLLLAYKQPYGTLLIPGDTPKLSFDQVLYDVRSGRAPLGELLSYPSLGWRIIIYFWHYYTLILGSLGLVLAIQSSGWKVFPLVGWIVYNSVLLAFLAVEPRYLFPVMFAFTIFAAYGSMRLWNLIRFAVNRSWTMPGKRANAHPARQ